MRQRLILTFKPNLLTEFLRSRTAWDAAAVLSVIAGYDQPDASSIDSDVPNYIDLISVNKEKGAKYKLGIPNEFFFDQIDHKVIDIFEGFVSSLHEVGISTNAVKFEDTDKIYDTWRAFRLSWSTSLFL
jgi:aspartyl-tRNA(Asn)/glutamyl-tRNA(Gln) amidotransferase subunit A